MGKKKKLTEKVKLFYKGPLREPTKVADDNAIKTIVEALTEYCALTGDRKIFTASHDSGKVTCRLHLGLKSSLRCLKHQRCRAVIYDDTASPHLSKYLNEFGHKLNIPVIQAHRLIDVAPKLKLKTLLTLSVEEVAREEEEDGESLVDHSSETMDKFWHFLSESKDIIKTNRCVKKFEPPVLERVCVTGKSKAKKESKRVSKNNAKFDGL